MCMCICYPVLLSSLLCWLLTSQAPTFAACPTDLTVTALQGSDSISVHWIPPTATDNIAIVGLTAVGDCSDCYLFF
jgi:hypothetical protein